MIVAAEEGIAEMIEVEGVVDMIETDHGMIYVYY